jgi:hypothetical protein
MKFDTKSESCRRELGTWRGEAFWLRVDKAMKLFDHPAYWYVTLGLLLFGTILGVIAPLLK